MRIQKTNIAGVVVLTPDIFRDERGYFFESFNKKTFASSGITNEWVQDNESRSVYGVIRGLHFQQAPYAQAKLVRVVEGEIYDVAVDLRSGSPTFGKWEGVLLSAENHKLFMIPKGFAHGFSVQSRFATVLYKCDEMYHPEADSGIRYDDPVIRINWKIPSQDIIVSNKDKNLSLFNPGQEYFPGK